MASPSQFESATWLATGTKSSSTLLALTYPPSSLAMNAQRLGQSFMTYPMPLQRWYAMLVERLDEAPV
jgi:hypothetical protein